MTQLEAFRQGYIDLAEAALKVLDKATKALDQNNLAHDEAAEALLRLALALDKSKQVISAAQQDE